MGFGDRLKHLREAAGLSQLEFAEAADIPIDSIQNWEQERTRPRLEALGKLAKALGVSVDSLVMVESEPHKEKGQPAKKRGRPRKTK